MNAQQQTRFVPAALTALAMLAAPAVVQAQAPDKPQSENVTIRGTVVDMSCRFAHGLSGDQHRMCAQVCADRGIPLVILSEDGMLYLPTSPAMPGDSQNERLKEFAEQRVTVTGKAFKAGGARAINIETIKRM